MQSVIGTLETKDYKHFTIRPEESSPPTPVLSFEATSNEITGRALPGDTVHWNGTKVDQVLLRAGGEERSHLFLVGTLELNSKTRYGITSHGAMIYRFSPYNEAYPPFFVGCASKEAQPLLVRIAFEKWEEGSTLPRGVLVQTFGKAGDQKAEEEALLAHYCPERWKASDLKDVPPIRIDTGINPYRNEFSPNFIGCFNIDPPGCQDVDDAFSLSYKDIYPAKSSDKAAKDRLWELSIHITDVASALLKNGWLSQKASAIGQTFYRDGEALRPMFPKAISEGELSLLPQKKRNVLTLSIAWSEASKRIVDKPRWSLETISITGAHTYESAMKASWATYLKQITSTIAGKELNDSHEWIEHMMIFYNCEAAAFLKRMGAGVLRKHEAPDWDRFQQMKALGLPAERLAMSAGQYCPSTDSITYHWGLNAPAYCHVTSPLRRWADCLNQMALLHGLGFTGEEVRVTEGAHVKREDIDRLNACSKRAKAFERDILFLRALLGTQAGGKVGGTIVENGRVWIESWGRIVKMETGDAAPGDIVGVRYYCDPTQRCWKRRLVLRLDS